MSSREIAELVESRHDNVKRSIERLSNQGVIRFTPSEETSHEGAGARMVEVYLLEKRDTYIVVAQLSPQFTARLVDRWQELEAMQAPAIPQTYAEALRLAADQAEQIEQQRLLIEHQKPAVEFVERYVEAKSSKSLSDVAKVIGHKPRAFIALLADDGVIFKRGGSWVPFQQHIDAGRFSVHTGESSGHVFLQTRVEPKGVEWLARKYGGSK